MKRTSIIIALCLIAALLITLQLCNTNENFHDTKGEQFWREQNEKEMMKLSQGYQKNLSGLQAKNDSLKKELNYTSEKLRTSKFKQRLSEQKVLALAQPDTSYSIKDRLSKCDSLKAEVTGYVRQVDSTEAYYDTALVQLKAVIAVKDTALNMCNVDHEKLENIIEDNSRREQRLTEELQKALRQNKRKNIQNKFLSAGLLVLTGIGTAILIRSK